MRSDTLRQWLADRGCRFDQHEHAKGQGIPSVTVRHEGRSSVLPLIGSNKDLDPEDVRRVVEELGFDYSELPGVKDKT
jgi:hypothetical protein